ncbi:MAG: phosphoribosylanthranilate isomerase [Legionellaceae bacterium]|nr:phosphoribosylanthranilate isomerase [Legionellaceae bacterium]
MRAKICGITTLADAQLAVRLGAWALGFNFYKKSPRFIAPSAAKAIIAELPASVLKVGLLIDEIPRDLEAFMHDVGLDLLQVYTLLEVPLRLKKRMILGVNVTCQEALPAHAELDQYAYLLLDAPKDSDGVFGGTGRLSNWALATQLAKKYRLFLAGGLNPQNVQAAIQAVDPYAVDVASGVQAVPGRLEPILLTDFLRRVNDEF